MKNAFTYMFNDNDFAKKVLTIWGINLIGYFTITWFQVYPAKGMIEMTAGILAIIAGLISTGYGISCVKSFIENKDFSIPEIDFIKNGKLGLKLAIAVLITFASIFACSVLFYIIMKFFLAPIQIILGLFYTVVFFVYLFCCLGFSRNFATTENLLSYLQFKKIATQIKENKSTYIKAFWFYIGFTVAMSFVNYLFGKVLLLFDFKTVNIFGLSIFNSLLTTYTIFVTSYLIANCMEDKETENE